MGRSVILAIVVIAIAMSISFQHVHTLKCWTCSSDGVKSDGKFCNDPFEPQKSLNESVIKTIFKECAPKEQHNVFCRKLTQTVENSAVIFRSCYYKPTNATKDECYDKEKTVSYIKNVDCKVCDADGCNGASAYGPIALMMIGPVAVAKVLLF